MSNGKGGGGRQPQTDGVRREISGTVKLAGVNGVVTVSKSSEVMKAEELAAVETRDREKRKFRLDIATLVFAAVAGSATFGQLLYLRETVIETREGERPYLLSDGVKFLGSKQAPPQEGDAHGVPSMAFEILFDNFGKSPALNVKVSTQYFIGDHAEDQARSWFLTLPIHPSKPTPDADVIPPNGSREYGSFRVDVPMEFTDPILIMLNRKVYVVDRVVYEDSFGKSYPQSECHIYDGDTNRSFNCPWGITHP